MGPENSNQSDRETRLAEVLLTCLEAADRGQALDREALLARYPDLADELEEVLAGQDRVECVTGPLRQMSRATRLGRHAVQDTPGPEEDPVALTGLPCRFGDYELLEEIGRGGMGVVYKARQISLNRTVALKLLRPGNWGDAADLRRFRNEAETVAGLDHPNLVPVHEVGERDGRVYFTMKLVEGGSLADRLADFRATPRKAATVVAAVARAVHYAHQRGVLHRDLKPANVLLASRGVNPRSRTSPTLAWPSGWRWTAALPSRAPSSARRATWHPSRRKAARGRSPRPPTCTA
jgi:serine/threonine-protein kinase